MIREKCERLGNLFYHNTPSGTIIFLLNDETYTYARIYLTQNERKWLLSAIIDGEIGYAGSELKDIEKELTQYTPSEEEKKAHEEKAKRLLIYKQNLEAVKKLLEDGGL